MIEQLIQSFREETEELLADLETSLLELKRQPDDSELVDRIFRAMHTIKGSSAMFGFEAMASLSHEVEAVLDLLRSGSIQLSAEIVAVILLARDRLKTMLHAPAGSIPAQDTGEIVAAIRSIAVVTERRPAPCTAVPNVATEEAATTYTITFRPGREIFRRGLRPRQILHELRELGDCRISVLTDEVPLLAELDPELCYLGWQIELTTAAGSDAVNDVFMFVDDDSRLEIVAETIAPAPTDDSSAGNRAAGRQDETTPETAAERGLAGKNAISSIRVAAAKLDQLVNLVGELVTVQARLSQMSAAKGDTELAGLAEEMERLTAGLRDTALNVRMVPIGSTFGRFRRLVHDLSLELGKEVELVTAGAETELDKTVMEKLADPLVHLIRNSIDHGIEPPSIRLAAGKPAHGIIRLAALHSGDSVLVTISDDGCGIDREAVRARAVANGLIPAGVELPDKDLLGLIFAPGFSTAAAVTSISGRGVGMDVVKKGVDALRGSIAITSNPGEGTAVTIRIPLTLAIIESLLVRIGSDCFVLPLANVQECIELTGEDIVRAHGRHLADVRGRITPYIPLRQRFGIAGARPEIEQIVIVELEGKQVGLVVDHVIGEHQTVIKSIGKMFREVSGVSGATILGDGSVALILDLQQLIVEEEQTGDGPGAAEEFHRRAVYA